MTQKKVMPITLKVWSPANLMFECQWNNGDITLPENLDGVPNALVPLGLGWWSITHAADFCAKRGYTMYYDG